MTAPQPEPTKKRRRWPRRLGMALVVLLALLGAAWWQRDAALELVLASLLGADAEVSGFSPGTATHIDVLQWTESLTPGAAPAITASDIDVQFGGSAGRYVSSASIGELALNLLQQPDSNYGFLTRLASQPSSGFDATPYLPEKFAIARLPLRVESPALSLSLDGLSVDADVTSKDAIAARLHGGAISGSWHAPDTGMEARDISGSLDASLKYAPGATTASFQADVTGLAKGGGALIWRSADEFSLVLDNTTLESALWLELARPWLPVDARFERLDIAQASATFGGGANEFAFGGRAIGLGIGPVDAPWYAGDAALEFTGSQGEALTTTGTLKLDGAAPVKIESLQWTGTVTPGEALSVLADIAPVLTGAKDGYALKLGVSRDVDAAWLVSAEGARAEQQEWTLGARLPDEGTWEAALAADDLDARAWLADWLGGTDWIDATMTGEVKATQAEEPALMQHTATLKGALRRIGPLESDTALDYALSTNGLLNREAPLAAPLDADLKIDGVGTLGVKGGKADAASGTLPLTADFDIARVAALLGLAGLGGQASGKADLHYQDGNYELRGLDLDLADFWHGEVAMPPGDPVALNGKLDYAAAANRINTTLDAVWRENTRANCADCAYEFGKGTASAGTFSLTSDLALLIELGYVESGEATIEASAKDVRWSSDGQSGTGEMTITGGIVLPDALLAVVGMNLEAYANFENSVSAAGPLTAGEIIAFGATLKNLSAQVRTLASDAYFEQAKADLWGGGIVAGGEVNIFREGMPLRFEAEVTGIDLLEFSRHFKLPYGDITGKVSGHVRASIANGEITELDADLESTEGFSMSRELVVQAMMSQNDSEVSGSRVISSVVAKVIGDDVQRPFDRARIRLGLDGGGRITGIAELNSKSLNLTIDIRADQAALLEAMKGAQEGTISGLKFQ